MCDICKLCAAYLYLDLKKYSPPLSDLQPVLLWTCCPWKRDVVHLRLHRLFLGIHYQAYYSPPAVHRRERQLFAPLKPHFIRSMQSHSPELTNKAKCQREKAATVRPTSGVTVRCAGDTRSVSPASKSCVSAVAVAGSIAPAFCCYCTLRLQSTHYNINCVILLQCLPRDGVRPPTTGPCKLIATTRLLHFYYPSQSRLKKTSQSAHHSLCFGTLSHPYFIL